MNPDKTDRNNHLRGHIRIFSGRFSLLISMSAIFLAASLITRAILVVKYWHGIKADTNLILKIFGTGLLFDLAALSYLTAILSFLLILVPNRIYRGYGLRLTYIVLFFPVVFLVVFSSFAEYLFFVEYGTRFNFIAVDYLVYTSEVIRNIWESYPILPILAAVFSISALLFVPVWRTAIKNAGRSESPFMQRFKQGAAFMLLPLFALIFVDHSDSGISTNNYANEVASNGIYNLFAAFRLNQIDYDTFYATEDKEAVFKKLRTLIKEDDSEYVSADLFNIGREIREEEKEKRLNIVTIVVESLSADFLGVFGNSKGLTPNIDALAKESLLFTNMYATGTRTDRGLEAITLSVPPTPGRSIIKRNNNEGMFSWGSLMQSKGYDSMFIYGGYGYFDNMNYFFSHNGYRTIDRKNIAAENIHFANAWGVCDEDLFGQAIREFNSSYGKGKPFFAEIMTTSNHRPYTYPEGRIDIPSHTGRNGAVKYTDYAIGKFIEEARKEPWFKDTVFVIVADHCANSAGKTALPVRRYEIPMLVYSPAHIKPGRIDRLASQIDIAPTVLDLLEFSYEDRFFGKDILAIKPGQERAFISTYQKLGYMNNSGLVILEPGKKIEYYSFDRNTGKMQKSEPSDNIKDEAITYYQAGSYLFRESTVTGNRYAEMSAEKRL